MHLQNFSDSSKCISPVDYGKRVTFRCLDFRFSENNLIILLLNTFLPKSIEKFMEKIVAFGFKWLLKLFGVFLENPTWNELVGETLPHQRTVQSKQNSNRIGNTVSWWRILFQCLEIPQNFLMPVFDLYCNCQENFLFT